MITKELETFGYIHNRKLTLSTDHAILTKNAPLKQIPESLCVYYDVLVDDSFVDNNNNNDISYGQFYDAMTASSREMIRSRHTSFIPSTTEQRRFVKNDKRRDNLISEFIVTEDNYVASLRAFITSIVHPIRMRARDKQKRILGPYECGKVFMNIEQILQVNEAFRLDLARYQSTSSNNNNNTATSGTGNEADPSSQQQQQLDFGEICLIHLRRFVGCYHKFLLGVENAQTFNTKEQKDNPTYDAYLDKIKGTMGNQTVYDYLALPGQRVGRYTMFLKELMKHTTDDHPDLPSLTEALKTAEEIANMSEDYHTKLIKIFHNMLQSIQHCPASLLSQQRSLICHLDASELDPQTLRPAHPVTLFLFTDKLMVVRRPSYVSDGLELCGLDHERDKTTGMLSLLVRKAESSSKRLDRKLKFRGWISLNDIEIHDGAAELPTSFTLVTSVTDTASETDPQTRDALEGYFLEDAFRLFHVSGEYTSTPTKTLMQEKEKFVEQFGKAKSSHRRHDEHLLEFTQSQWKGRYFFANIYRLSTYSMLPNKSEMAIAYLREDSLSNMKAQLTNCYIIPHMLGFIIPEDDHFKFSILSKLALGCVSEGEITSSCELDLSTHTESAFQNFRDRFLGNLYACDKDLREVSRMATLSLRHRRRQRSSHQQQQRVRYPDNTIKPMRMTFHKELSRRRSISTFKLFGNLGNNSNNNSSTSPSASSSTTAVAGSNIISTSSPIPSATSSGTPRRKSISSDEWMRGSGGFLESRISTTFSSSSNESHISSGTEEEATTSTTEDIYHHRNHHNHHTAKRKSTGAMTGSSASTSPMTNTVRRKSLTETIASVYRPSIHPSQTSSYELSSKDDMSKNKSMDGLEERIRQLSSTLQKSSNHRYSTPAQPSVRSRLENLDNNDNNTIITASPRHTTSSSSSYLPSNNNNNRRRSSLSPDESNNSSFTTLRNSSRETLSSIGGTSTHSSSGHHSPHHHYQTKTPPLSYDLTSGKQTQVDEKISELLAHIKGQSPVSNASTDSSSIRTPSPAAATSTASTTPINHSDSLEKKMIAEMELMKSEFSRRYDAMMNDYEELGTVVRQLNKQLKKRDEELSILRIRYEDAMAENDLLYEAFNNELDQMYDLFEQKSSSRGRRTATSMDHPHEQQGGDTNNQRRPAHPSPEAQIRKKLELTIKERNQWHQTACKLARELQSLSQMSGSSSSLNTTPSSSSTNISMMAATSTTTSHNIRPANSRSTPIPPFRHSSQ